VIHILLTKCHPPEAYGPSGPLAEMVMLSETAMVLQQAVAFVLLHESAAPLVSICEVCGT